MTSTSRSLPAETRLSPSRIRLARERRGLSKVALAQRLSVTTRVLQTYETDGAPLARAGELASELGVLPGFFSLPELDAVTREQGFFRALRRATAGQLARARASAALGVDLFRWIDERYDLPTLVMPEGDEPDPELAAGVLRALWGRGPGDPLPNLIQLSEAHGVRVLSLPIDAEAVDAFSLWQDGRPYVFLSRTKTPERSRFDLAHELGHLMLHSRLPAEDTTGVQLEREANQFAAAFLMPRGGLSSVAGREGAVPQVLELRSYFRVSAMAMARRLHEIGKLTEWTYRQNVVELARRGFRTSEPDGISPELSRVFGTVFSDLRDRGITPSEVAAELGLTSDELHRMTLGHVTVPISGAGLPDGTPTRRHLSIVR